MGFKLRVKLAQEFFQRMPTIGESQNSRHQFALLRTCITVQVEMGMCAECVESIALFHCVQCADLYCRDCYQARSRIASSQKCMYRPKLSILSLNHGFCETFKNICQEWHVRGGRRNHIPIILRSFNSQTHQLPEATPAMGTGAAQILAKAR